MRSKIVVQFCETERWSNVPKFQSWRFELVSQRVAAWHP